MRGPSFFAGSWALIGRRMAKDSSAVATIRRAIDSQSGADAAPEARMLGQTGPESTPRRLSGAALRQMVANRSNRAGPGHVGIQRQRGARDPSRIEVLGDPGTAARPDRGAARIAQ